MMAKKSLKAILILVCVLFAFSTPIFATEEMPSFADNDLTVGGDVGEESPEAQPSEDISPIMTAPAAPVGNDCLCGREYYTENVGEHSKYDCIKCGKNMYACTCNCWCGATTVLDTTGNYGSVSPRLCSGCNKPCPECDCRDDKAIILAAEKLRLSGEVSPLNLPRPENGLNLFFSLLILLICVCAAVFLPHAPFLAKKNQVSEEEIDITEVLSLNTDLEEIEGEETPEEKFVEKVDLNGLGVSVYDKISLHWMASSGNIITINASAAKVIVNDSEVISGDLISVNEISEKLMSDESSCEKREARFPEFFGEFEEEINESEGELQ